MFGPRAAEWEAIFGTATICVQSPVAVFANVMGEEQLVYFLDLDTLTPNEFARLVEHLAGKFDLPADELPDLICTHGVPILAADCVVVVLNPARWIDFDAEPEMPF